MRERKFQNSEYGSVFMTEQTNDCVNGMNNSMDAQNKCKEN